MTQVVGLIFVFLYYFGGIDFNSWIVTLTISIMLVFLRSLDLKRTISRKGIVGLSFVLISVFLIGFVFIFLD